MAEESLHCNAVARRLDVLIALALRDANNGDNRTKEDALFLSSFGMSHPDIAAILGISANGVSKALGRAKKR
ncbi:MAG TPA: sigma factor-like helix-turn-helix DNA-binding protein [Acidobacteriaceae bacterium]|nr:sigma factor-like helix-turn-helix DNA-binding protein [Acidobacteriaceae bacterium]